MTSLDTSAAQIKLHQTRKELRVLLSGLMEDDHFPRSATMKWLLSTGGQRVIGYVAGGSISRFAPRIGTLFRILPISLLIKKFWSRKKR